ncbi:MAG TPA: hypothetical protein VGZ91_17530 [Candidatus Sulfotelmatobacter sp.]|jgi:hypothetical protein|nr:hypothetical protein [Candidatus Sulfotelmatobacter sp.]
MTIQISQLTQKSMLRNLLRTLTLALLGSLIMATPLLAAEKPSQHAAAHQDSAPAGLVQLVREGTKQYINVNNATAAGYGPFLGCVAGTDHGAMGVHYVNPILLGNLTLDPSQPQALIYEPSSDGKMTLVGVEFILDSASWLAANNNTSPVLDGQVFNFVGFPNRFSINSFFELHVWAWRDNPQGSFVDWNNDVTCAGETN